MRSACAGTPLALGISILVVISLCAQQKQEPAVFKAETNLATVSFRVATKGGYADSLTQQDITLLEDGVPKPIAFLEGGGRARRSTPIEIAILFDPSALKSGDPAAATSLEEMTKFGNNLSAFKSTLLDLLPNASIAIYSFDTELRRLCRPTRDPRELSSAFLKLVSREREGDRIKLSLPPGRKERTVNSIFQTWYRNWPYEAIITALRDRDDTVPPIGTRMLLVFSYLFSATNSSPEDAAAVARELGVPIYPVPLGYQGMATSLRQQEMYYARVQADPRSASDASNSDRTMASQRKALDDMEALASLAQLTGGRPFLYNAFSADQMLGILKTMQQEASAEYVAGFAPPVASGTPKKHTIEVKLVSNKTGKLVGGKRTLTY